MNVLIPALLAAAAIAAYPAAAAAQSPRGSPDDEDMSAVYATPVEVAEGKRIAEETCARCHGANGVSATKGVPHLAGQRAAYLHLQLRAYRQSARVQGAMTGIVRYLSDDALVKVAAYYASLEPPRAAPPAPKGTAAKPDAVQAGKAAAAACGGCHGETGVSAMPGTPSLVALDPKYFIGAMQAYKSGQRANDMMKGMAAGVSESDVSNIALFYALQKPARAKTPAAGNAAAGKKAASACGACHGDSGVSGNPATPSLAGQDAQYLAAAVEEYKSGARKDESMKGPASELNERAIKDIAAYYASQQPQPLNVRRPLTVSEWTDRCDRCHGPGGNSTDPMIPRLAAQRIDWLEQVLHAYRTGTRKSTAMSAMSALLSEDDVKQLAAHYARQNARAVTYIVLPPAGKKRDK
ncbi:MAG: c-type cytochrome [Betaproteobacteria bacterium]|nr:MAG: c-type cytochrome [Betaproteobacteria bacterium]